MPVAPILSGALGGVVLTLENGIDDDDDAQRLCIYHPTVQVRPAAWTTSFQSDIEAEQGQCEPRRDAIIHWRECPFHVTEKTGRSAAPNNTSILFVTRTGRVGWISLTLDLAGQASAMFVPTKDARPPTEGIGETLPPHNLDRSLMHDDLSRVMLHVGCELLQLDAAASAVVALQHNDGFDASGRGSALLDMVVSGPDSSGCEDATLYVPCSFGVDVIVGVVVGVLHSLQFRCVFDRCVFDSAARLVSVSCVMMLSHPFRLRQEVVGANDDTTSVGDGHNYVTRHVQWMPYARDFFGRRLCAVQFAHSTLTGECYLEHWYVVMLSRSSDAVALGRAGSSSAVDAADEGPWSLQNISTDRLAFPLPFMLGFHGVPPGDGNNNVPPLPGGVASSVGDASSTRAVSREALLIARKWHRGPPGSKQTGGGPVTVFSLLNDEGEIGALSGAAFDREGPAVSVAVAPVQGTMAAPTSWATVWISASGTLSVVLHALATTVNRSRTNRITMTHRATGGTAGRPVSATAAAPDGTVFVSSEPFDVSLSALDTARWRRYIMFDGAAGDVSATQPTRKLLPGEVWMAVTASRQVDTAALATTSRRLRLTISVQRARAAPLFMDIVSPNDVDSAVPLRATVIGPVSVSPSVTQPLTILAGNVIAGGGAVLLRSCAAAIDSRLSLLSHTLGDEPVAVRDVAANNPVSLVTGFRAPTSFIPTSDVGDTAEPLIAVVASAQSDEVLALFASSSSGAPFAVKTARWQFPCGCGDGLLAVVSRGVRDGPPSLAIASRREVCLWTQDDRGQLTRKRRVFPGAARAERGTLAIAIATTVAVDHHVAERKTIAAPLIAFITSDEPMKVGVLFGNRGGGGAPDDCRLHWLQSSFPFSSQHMTHGGWSSVCTTSWNPVAAKPPRCVDMGLAAVFSLPAGLTADGVLAPAVSWVSVLLTTSDGGCPGEAETSLPSTCDHFLYADRRAAAIDATSTSEVWACAFVGSDPPPRLITLDSEFVVTLYSFADGASWTPAETLALLSVLPVALVSPNSVLLSQPAICTWYGRSTVFLAGNAVIRIQDVNTNTWRLTAEGCVHPMCGPTFAVLSRRMVSEAKEDDGPSRTVLHFCVPAPFAAPNGPDGPVEMCLYASHVDVAPNPTPVEARTTTTTTTTTTPPRQMPLRVLDLPNRHWWVGSGAISVTMGAVTGMALSFAGGRGTSLGRPTWSVGNGASRMAHCAMKTAVESSSSPTSLQKHLPFSFSVPFIRVVHEIRDSVSGRCEVYCLAAVVYSVATRLAVVDGNSSHASGVPFDASHGRSCFDLVVVSAVSVPAVPDPTGSPTQQPPMLAIVCETLVSSAIALQALGELQSRIDEAADTLWKNGLSGNRDEPSGEEPRPPTSEATGFLNGFPVFDFIGSEGRVLGPNSLVNNPSSVGTLWKATRVAHQTTPPSGGSTSPEEQRRAVIATDGQPESSSHSSTRLVVEGFAISVQARPRRPITDLDAAACSIASSFSFVPSRTLTVAPRCALDISDVWSPSLHPVSLILPTHLRVARWRPQDEDGGREQDVDGERIQIAAGCVALPKAGTTTASPTSMVCAFVIWLPLPPSSHSRASLVNMAVNDMARIFDVTVKSKGSDDAAKVRRLHAIASLSSTSGSNLHVRETPPQGVAAVIGEPMIRSLPDGCVAAALTLDVRTGSWYAADTSGGIWACKVAGEVRGMPVKLIAPPPRHLPIQDAAVRMLTTDTVVKAALLVVFSGGLVRHIAL